MIIKDNRIFVATVGGKLVIYDYNNGDLTRKFEINNQ